MTLKLLKKAADKAKISYEDARDIVAISHQNAHFYKPKELTDVVVNFDDKTKAYLDRVTKALHVDVDAVVAWALEKL